MSAVDCKQEYPTPNVKPLTMCAFTCRHYVESVKSIFANSSVCDANPDSDKVRMARQEIVIPKDSNFAQFCQNLQQDPASKDLNTCYLGTTSDFSQCGFLNPQEAVAYCTKPENKDDPCCLGDKMKELISSNTTSLISNSTDSMASTLNLPSSFTNVYIILVLSLIGALLFSLAFYLIYKKIQFKKHILPNFYKKRPTKRAPIESGFVNPGQIIIESEGEDQRYSMFQELPKAKSPLTLKKIQFDLPPVPPLPDSEEIFNVDYEMMNEVMDERYSVASTTTTFKRFVPLRGSFMLSSTFKHDSTNSSLASSVDQEKDDFIHQRLSALYDTSRFKRLNKLLGRKSSAAEEDIESNNDPRDKSSSLHRDSDASFWLQKY